MKGGTQGTHHSYRSIQRSRGLTTYVAVARDVGRACLVEEFSRSLHSHHNPQAHDPPATIRDGTANIERIRMTTLSFEVMWLDGEVQHPVCWSSTSTKVVDSAFDSRLTSQTDFSAAPHATAWGPSGRTQFK